MTTTLESPVPASDETVEAAPPRRFTRRTWDRFGFGVLLIATLVTYLWDITVNGMGNQFYAGAAQAGSRNWEALLFGSLDTQNYIAVDEPPVSQWVMGLSGQILGFSSASMLVPEALMAVATVALLYGAVRRISGPNAALLAGAAFALTPVAALMFPYNNPDAVMVLLVMPAIGLVYLVAAPTSVRKRLLPARIPRRVRSLRGLVRRADTAVADIRAWVAANFTATTVGNGTVYDLTAPLK